MFGPYKAKCGSVDRISIYKTIQAPGLKILNKFGFKLPSHQYCDLREEILLHSKRMKMVSEMCVNSL